MISADEWWNVLENYNLTIFPAQIVLHITAILLIALFFLKPEAKASMILKIYLTFSFAWIGIAFFLLLGTALDNYVFSALLFILLAFFFGIDLIRNRIEFEVPETRYEKIIMIILLIIVFLYPLVGYLVGHIYPRMIFVGTFPCSTTALALILLAFSIPKIELKPYIVLLIWAIPFPIFIQIPRFGVYEDAIMLTAGIVALILLIKKRKLLTRECLI